MTTAAPPAQELTAAIDATLPRLEALLALLGEERAALRGRQVAEVEAIAGRKTRLLTDLEAHGREVLLVLSHHQLRPDPAAIARATGDAALGERFGALVALLGELAHRNRVNGGVIELSRRHVDGLIAVLRGQTPGARLYGRHGEVRRGHEPGSLATA